MESAFRLIQLFWADLQHGQLPELGPLNYVLLSLLIVVQGPVATLLGGAAAATGLLRPSLVLVSGVVGNLTADVLWYWAGTKGKIEWVLRYFKWLGVRHDHIERLQQSLRRYAPKILLLAKLSAGFAVPALIAAGMSRIRWRRWFPVVFLGETLWTGGLVLLGYFAAEAIRHLEQGVHVIVLGTSLGFLFVFLWLLPRFLRQSALLTPPGAPHGRQSGPVRSVKKEAQRQGIGTP
jgi:membrane protein DedA with SNARE-associated domain